MQDLEAGGERLEKANAVAFGLSIDTTFSKKAWAESLGIEKTRLLSDFWPHGEVADAYGLFDDAAGRTERAVVIVDEKGVVRWMKVYPVPERPDIEEIMVAVEGI
jgi:alkyl hydroperoxide reductase subunit AhpC